MAKRKSKDLEEIYYPVPTNFTLDKSTKPTTNNAVIRNIIKGAVKGAYKLKNPREYDYQGYAIEAALASQFAITYIRGLDDSSSEYSSKSSMMELFEFGHKVLETFTRYRTKGAQLISVNYNHNQGQINNIKIVEGEKQPDTIEVNSEHI